MKAKHLSSFIENPDFKSKIYKKTLNDLFPYAPSESWLTNLAKANDLIIKNPISLEEARRKIALIKT